jgi:hypothetical protein
MNCTECRQDYVCAKCQDKFMLVNNNCVLCNIDGC